MVNASTNSGIDTIVITLPGLFGVKLCLNSNDLGGRSKNITVRVALKLSDGKKPPEATNLASEVSVQDKWKGRRNNLMSVAMRHHCSFSSRSKAVKSAKSSCWQLCCDLLFWERADELNSVLVSPKTGDEHSIPVDCATEVPFARFHREHVGTQAVR